MSTEDRQYNPFAAPESEQPVASEFGVAAVKVEPLPCPACGSEGAQPAPYSAWHGRRAPKAIQDVICTQCGANFDGETGIPYPPRRSPLLWFLVALGLFLLYIFGFPLLLMLLALAG